MKVTRTIADRFEMSDLSKDDLYLLSEALTYYKHDVLKDPEAFEKERQHCIDLYLAMETEIIKIKK